MADPLLRTCKLKNNMEVYTTQGGFNVIQNKPAWQKFGSGSWKSYQALEQDSQGSGRVTIPGGI